jgi:hypothetical protein
MLELRLKIHAIEVKRFSIIFRRLIFIKQFNLDNAGSSTLPRPTTKATEADLIRSDKPATTASTTSLYDNVASGNQGQSQQGKLTLESNWMNLKSNKFDLIKFTIRSYFRNSPTSKVRYINNDRNCFRWNSTKSRRTSNQSR